MCLETDREFNKRILNNLIKSLVLIKAFAAEQKIRELKKLLLRSKRIKKSFYKALILKKASNLRKRMILTGSGE